MTETFAKKGKKKHGDWYDYSKVIYLNSRMKVLIGCPLHGFFPQTPDLHLHGHGCKKCTIEKHRSSTEKFAQKGREIHGDWYIYDKVDYVTAKKKVEIICPEHGLFRQKPCSHLAGHGCEKCAGNHNYTTEEFVEKGTSIHGNIYDYSETKYIDMKTDVTIRCKTHGSFTTNPSQHLRGFGCSKCNASKGEALLDFQLTKRDFKFEIQKTFENCKSKGLLRFDFYIEKLNLCIEFDGKQHFRPSSKFGGEERFQQSIIRDTIKTEYCKKNGINLLRLKDVSPNKLEKNLDKGLKLCLLGKHSGHFFTTSIDYETRGYIYELFHYHSRN